MVNVLIIDSTAEEDNAEDEMKNYSLSSSQIVASSSRTIGPYLRAPRGIDSAFVLDVGAPLRGNN